MNTMINTEVKLSLSRRIMAYLLIWLIQFPVHLFFELIAAFPEAWFEAMDSTEDVLTTRGRRDSQA